jgi:uncharacterized Zn-finger protein
MFHQFMLERNLCDYSCSQKAHLKTHVASIHERKKLFKCDICEKNFSQRQAMKNHFAIVHEEKRIKYTILQEEELIQDTDIH